MTIVLFGAVNKDSLNEWSSHVVYLSYYRPDLLNVIIIAHPSRGPAYQFPVSL